MYRSLEIRSKAKFREENFTGVGGLDNAVTARWNELHQPGVKTGMGILRFQCRALSYFLILISAASVILVVSTPPKETFPGTLSEREIGILMGQPAQHVHRFFGMTFYRGRLYLSTYVGLLEVVHFHLSKIYRIRGDSNASGPWTDVAHDLLWTLDADTRKLARFDGSTWSSVNEPRIMLDSGVWLGGNATGFWMTTARWDTIHQRWESIESPPRDVPAGEPFGVLGILPIGSVPLMVLRHWGPHRGYLKPMPPDSDTIAVFDHGWRIMRPPAGAEFFARSFVTAGDTGYICAYDGTMFRVSLQHIDKLEAPGLCETVATTSDGKLVVSIPTKGIFQFDGGWAKLADHPHPTASGKYQAYLAVDGSTIAYSTVAEDLPGFHPTDGKESWAPTTQLWIAQNGKFQLVLLRE